MKQITVLKVDEIAKILDLSENTIYGYISKSSPVYDPNFPVVKIGNITRFVKEKVLPYIERKKKEDCVPRLLDTKSLVLQFQRENFLNLDLIPKIKA